MRLNLSLLTVVVLGGCAQKTLPPTQVQADIDLAEAIVSGDAPAASKAIQAGAQVNKPLHFDSQYYEFYSGKWDSNDVNDRLPLSVAVRKDSAPVVQVLLKAGAKPNALDLKIKATPLSLSPAVPVATLLVQHGADVNLPLPGNLITWDGANPTPLMTAVAARKPALVEFLLKNGAKVQGRDKYGCTAWVYVHPERPDLRHMLLAHGAKPNDSGPSAQKLRAMKTRWAKELKSRDKAGERKEIAESVKEDLRIIEMTKH